MDAASGPAVACAREDCGKTCPRLPAGGAKRYIARHRAAVTGLAGRAARAAMGQRCPGRTGAAPQVISWGVSTYDLGWVYYCGGPGR